MAFGKIKKFILGTTLALVVGISASASACTIETKRPRAKFTVEFNDKEYVLEYDLYRNMYPQTVRHFIELASNGFYNDMVVHNYTSGDWFSGGYTYNADAYGTAVSGDEGTVKEYFEENSKESAYYDLFKEGKFTSSVFKTFAYDNSKQVVNAEDALPTVMGEFKNNIGQVIENGALSAETGSLKMFYYTKQYSSKVYVTPTKDQIIQAEYKNNCATSIISLQVGSSEYTETKYCVFGKVRDAEALAELTEAVQTYLSDNFGSSTTVEASVTVDNMESFSTDSRDKGIVTTFKTPKKPIIVKTVKITKY